MQRVPTLWMSELAANRLMYGVPAIHQVEWLSAPTSALPPTLPIKFEVRADLLRLDLTSTHQRIQGHHLPVGH